MILIDWTAVVTGLAAGSVISTLYFAGLAFGVRLALRRENPVAILTLSAVLRILALLGAAGLVVWLTGPWAGIGFAAAFVVARLFATTFAKVTAP